MASEGKNAPTTQTSVIDKSQIEKAVSALYQYVKKTDDKSSLLLNEAKSIYLQLNVKKIARGLKKTVKVALPHGLLKESTSVCLLVKDLEGKKAPLNYEPTKDHFEDLLREKDIKFVSEIIPLRSLKLDYSRYEAKRNLSNLHDVFLADDRILHRLPTMLGKAFYKRKRQPFPVNLNASDLKAEMSKALNNTRCVIGSQGASCSLTVAHVGLKEEQVVENLVASIQRMVENVPGGQINIRNMCIKTGTSPSLPIYADTSRPENITLPGRAKKRKFGEPEDVTTIEEGPVRITPKGNVIVVKDKPEEEDEEEEEGEKQSKGVKERGAGEGGDDGEGSDEGEMSDADVASEEEEVEEAEASPDDEPEVSSPKKRKTTPTTPVNKTPKSSKKTPKTLVKVETPKSAKLTKTPKSGKKTPKALTKDIGSPKSSKKTPKSEKENTRQQTEVSSNVTKTPRSARKTRQAAAESKSPSPVKAKATPKSAKKTPKTIAKSPKVVKTPKSVGKTPKSATKTPASAKKTPKSAKKSA